MGGLLDKANAAKEPETEANAEPEPVVAAASDIVVIGRTNSWLKRRRFAFCSVQ